MFSCYSNSSKSKLSSRSFSFTYLQLWLWLWLWLMVQVGCRCLRSSQLSIFSISCIQSKVFWFILWLWTLSWPFRFPPFSSSSSNSGSSKIAGVSILRGGGFLRGSGFGVPLIEETLETVDWWVVLVISWKIRIFLALLGLYLEVKRTYSRILDLSKGREYQIISQVLLQPVYQLYLVGE